MTDAEERASRFGDATDASGDEESGATRRAIPLPGTLQSPRTKLVYLSLRLAGGSGVEARDLKRSLGMQTLALYPILRLLIDDGLVERVDGRYVATGAPEEERDENRG